MQLNAIGDADANGNPNTKATATTQIGSGVIFRGAQVTVTDYTFSSDAVKLTLKKGGAFVKDTHSNVRFESTGSTTIDSSTVLYLGDAAAGIYVDVAIHDGKLTIRQAGIRNPNSFYSLSGSGEDTVITLYELSNNLRGTAYLYTDNTATLTVYDQAMLPRVLVTNHTDYTLVLSAVYLTNNGYINPYVTSGSSSGKITANIQQVSYDNPTVTVETSGGGNLTVKRLPLQLSGRCGLPLDGGNGRRSERRGAGHEPLLRDDGLSHLGASAGDYRRAQRGQRTEPCQCLRVCRVERPRPGGDRR